MSFPPNYQQGKQGRLALYMVHGATEDGTYIKRSQSSESWGTVSGQGAGNVGRHRNGAKKDTSGKAGLHRILANLEKLV